MPKSRILIRPSVVTNRLSGLTSRWTMLSVVRGGESLGGLPRVVDRLARRAARLAAVAAQRFPFEQFGDDVRRASVAADVVDGQDVRVIELTGSARLLFEAMQPARIARPRTA